MNGILLIDKPAGWTSSDVVAKLRGILHERRIGHSGTLDPMATGLLVVFVGRATRAVEFAESQEKEYLAGLRLGLVTDTQDITGSADRRKPRECIGPEELEAVLPRFRGEIEQIPPMYSAIKVKGQKLYEIARRGGEVERKPRRITISELKCWPGGGGLAAGCPLLQGDLCAHALPRYRRGAGLRRLHERAAAHHGRGDFAWRRPTRWRRSRTRRIRGQAQALLLPLDSSFRAIPRRSPKGGEADPQRRGRRRGRRTAATASMAGRAIFWPLPGRGRELITHQKLFRGLKPWQRKKESLPWAFLTASISGTRPC